MNRTELHKKAMISALEKHLGIVTQACKTAEVGRTQHYAWMKEDPEYAAAVEAISESTIDFVESKLLQRINDGGDAAIIFYLKTKGRRRGYVEHAELTLTERPALSWLDEAGA